MSIPIAMTVNGKAAAADVDPRTLLVDFLRTNLGLTGTHIGCDTAQCGACTVHMNGRAIKACNVLAVQAQGAAVDVRPLTARPILAQPGAWALHQGSEGPERRRPVGGLTPGGSILS